MLSNLLKSVGFGALTVTLGALPSSMASADSYRDSCTKFVHQESGRGKTATVEKPARDLGNIISTLEAGDVVCIAEGTYLGRGKSGVDEINLAVSVIGGFSPDFTTRDPWGAHRTVFTGEHNSKNFKTGTRLTINTTKTATALMEVRGEPTEHTVIVDGIIFDNGPRNYYSSPEMVRIVRKGTPQNMPTPESGALTISTGINSKVVVANNVAVNFAPTQGVFSVFGGKAANVTIRDNVAINNTGSGFRLGTGFQGEESPTYDFENNMSVFNQKHSAFGTFGGSGAMLESATKVSITNSVFAFNDNYGIDNVKRSKNYIINNNVIAANSKSGFVEFDMEIDVEYIEDEAEFVEEAMDNTVDIPAIKVPEAWLKLYFARDVIDRNAAEADVKVIESWQNEVRSIFGLPLQGTDLDVDSAVWLPRLMLEDAMVAANAFRSRGAAVD